MTPNRTPSTPPLARTVWDVVGRYFTTAAVLDGLLLTLWLTGVVMVLGFLLGIPLAVMRVSADPVLRTPSWGYVERIACGNQTYQVIPLLMVATLRYIAVTAVLSAGSSTSSATTRVAPPSRCRPRLWKSSGSIRPRCAPGCTGRRRPMPARQSTVAGESTRGVAFPTFPTDLLGKY